MIKIVAGPIPYDCREPLCGGKRHTGQGVWTAGRGSVGADRRNPRHLGLALSAWLQAKLVADGLKAPAFSFSFQARLEKQWVSGPTSAQVEDLSHSLKRAQTASGITAAWPRPQGGLGLQEPGP